MVNQAQISPIAISVDVEDGINIAMRDVFDQEMAPTERVVTNTIKILELFSEKDIKGTFFVLGQVAERYPQLVKEIHNRGHEIGVHGYDHYKFDNMKRKTARDQLKRAKAVLEDLIGSEIKGHRAPAFSIDKSTKWGLELLAELGFKYDSSIMPCQTPNYGWSEFSKDITKISFENGNSIYEIPMSTVNIGTQYLPCLGGSYFRFMPFWITSQIIKRIGRKRNPVFYMHPYEIDTERYPNFYFEAMKSISYRSQLKMRSMWWMRGTVSLKIEKMVERFSTETMNSTLEKAIEGKQIPVLEMRMKEYEK